MVDTPPHRDPCRRRVRPHQTRRRYLLAVWRVFTACNARLRGTTQGVQRCTLVPAGAPLHNPLGKNPAADAAYVARSGAPHPPDRARQW